MSRSIMAGMKKKVGFLCAVGLIAACLCAPAVAGDEAGKLIYVAGNPDLYPIEYFDQKTDTYKGVIPSLLAQFSHEGVYRFVYIRPDKADQRAEMMTNRQAELISACTPADGFTQAAWKNGVTVLTTEEGDAAVEYRLLFTSIADESLRKYLADTLQKTSAGTIHALLIENAGNQAMHIPAMLLAGLSAAVIALMAGIIILVIRYRIKLKRCRLELETDAVTQTGNYDYLRRYYKQLINDHNRVLYSIVYFRIDADRIRRLSDGAEIDEALQYIAIVLKEYTSNTDILARVADNGFVMVKLSANDDEIANWIQPILRRIREYPERYEKSYVVDIHAGIYHLRAEDRDLDEMIFNASQSCGYAIMSHLDYAVCSDAIITAYKEESVLQEHTTLAFQNDEIKLYLHFFVQPSTQRIVGAEALCRWMHPDKGLLMPSRFIPLMEREGTITKLDYYMLEKVCSFLASLHEHGIGDFFISCNLSRRTFVSINLVDEVLQILNRYDFPRETLILELTESEISNSSELIYQNIIRLKEFGVRIAIDDFGSGYSSFEDLQKYPIDGLKLDKLLVDNAMTSEGSAILEGLINIGHHLGMTVLGEGAENREQIEVLSRLHCDVIQGFYFYQPMPQEEAQRVYFEHIGK